MDLPELTNTTRNLDFDGKRTIVSMAQWAVYNYIPTVIRWHLIRHVRMPQQPVKQQPLPLLSKTDDSDSQCLRLHIMCWFNDYQKEKKIVMILEVATNYLAHDNHHQPCQHAHMILLDTFALVLQSKLITALNCTSISNKCRYNCSHWQHETQIANLIKDQQSPAANRIDETARAFFFFFQPQFSPHIYMGLTRQADYSILTHLPPSTAHTTTYCDMQCKRRSRLHKQLTITGCEHTSQPNCLS